MVSLDVINRFKQKDEQAFEEIFNAYSNLTYYLAYKYTGNRSDSDDCVQDIFIKVVKNIDKYNEKKASFGTWLYQIAKNTILDYIKISNRYHSRVINHEELVYLYNDDKDNDIYDNELSKIENLGGEWSYHIVML